MKVSCRIAAFITLATLAVISLFACSGTAGDNNAPTLAPTAVVLPSVPVVVTNNPDISPTSLPVRATSTLPLSPTPRPTPCQLPIRPNLSDAWNEEELGCPITPGATISTAYAPFEGGQMLWRGDTDRVYVLYNDGMWDSYLNEWREGDAIYTCGEENSPPTPIRGFGRVWCDHADVSDTLGAVTAAEIGDDSSMIQDFVNGTILIAPFGSSFILVGEDGVWRRVEE